MLGLKLSNLIIALGFLSGCSLLPTPDEQIDRFILDPIDAQHEGTRALKAPLVMDQPVMYAPLDNVRIAVKPTPHTIDYLADVEWGDRLETLIHESTLQSLQNANIFQSVGRLNSGHHAHYLMAMDVRKFQKSESSCGAEVEYFVQIFDMDKRQAIASKLFYHCADLPKHAGAKDVALTLNKAHGASLIDIIQWLKRTL